MRKLLIILVFVFGFNEIHCQVSINSTNSAPDGSAMLDVGSSAKGVLVPRLTSVQRTGISSPANGLLVFDTDSASFWYYNASDWHEMLKGGGSANRLRVEADGSLFLQGSATSWNDMLFPFTSSKVGSNTKPAFNETYVGLDFPQGDATAQIFIIAQLPHGYKEGSAIYPHIHWQQSAATSVTWVMEYKWFNLNSSVPGAFTSITTSTGKFTYSSGNLNQISGFSSIDGTGKKISSMILIKIYRNDISTAGNVLGFQFDIHYETDAFGSRLEYIK